MVATSRHLDGRQHGRRKLRCDQQRGQSHTYCTVNENSCFLLLLFIFVGVPTGRGVGAKWDKAQERSGGWLDTYTDRSEQPAGEPEPEPCARVSLDQRDCCMCEGNN